MTAAGVEVEGALSGDHHAALLEYELAGGGVEHWVGLGNFYAITRYNHSRLYALAVYQLSLEIGAGRDARGG